MSKTSSHALRYISTITPALNEEHTISSIVRGIQSIKLPAPLILREIIVCDNGSTDTTAERAQTAGARVIFEPRKGYGQACLSAIQAAQPTDIFLFINADGAERMSEARTLLLPILEREIDLCVGSRVLGTAARGALLWHQDLGNRLATAAINRLYGCQLSDLGPFRAIRASALQQLALGDPDFGWIIEMQLKALDRGLRVLEVPVTTARTPGPSKISGTVTGSLGAGYKIGLYLLRFAKNRLFLYLEKRWQKLLFLSQIKL